MRRAYCLAVAPKGSSVSGTLLNTAKLDSLTLKQVPCAQASELFPYLLCSGLSVVHPNHKQNVNVAGGAKYIERY